MLFSALAPCVLPFYGYQACIYVTNRLNLIQSVPYIFLFWSQLKSPDLIYECTHFFFFFFMSNVFNVYSGQECQIHVELISMSITDFSYSQVGLTRPQSWSRYVLTQLPIRCQHYLVCLVLHKCTLLISGSYWVWNEANHVDFFRLFCHSLLLLWCYFHLFIPDPGGSHEWWKGWSLRQNRKVAPVSSHEGFSFTFPSAEVCVNHWVLCLTCEARSHLYNFCPFTSSFCLQITNEKNSLYFSSEWDQSTGLKVLRDVSPRSGSLKQSAH